MFLYRFLGYSIAFIAAISTTVHAELNGEINCPGTTQLIASPALGISPPNTTTILFISLPLYNTGGFLPSLTLNWTSDKRRSKRSTATAAKASRR